MAFTSASMPGVDVAVEVVLEVEVEELEEVEDAGDVVPDVAGVVASSALSAVSAADVSAADVDAAAAVGSFAIIMAAMMEGAAVEAEFVAVWVLLCVVVVGWLAVEVIGARSPVTERNKSAKLLSPALSVEDDEVDLVREVMIFCSGFAAAVLWCTR